MLNVIDQQKFGDQLEDILALGRRWKFDWNHHRVGSRVIVKSVRCKGTGWVEERYGMTPFIAAGFHRPAAAVEVQAGTLGLIAAQGWPGG